jgi:putative transposase
MENKSQALKSVNIPKQTYYRKRRGKMYGPPKKRPSPPRALSSEQKQEVLDVLHEARFQDKAPQEVYATLLDEGVFLCSIRTMYRILEEHNEVRERRNILRHPKYSKPELLATKPNQVWSWDITKLRGPAKWTSYYLYVMLDIFSRKAIGWMVAPRQTAELAEEFITECCWREGIEEDHLDIHSDRGTPMTSKAVALLMSDLGVTKSHSRPYVSNDNPYSEAHFKTLKFRPEFPKCFGSIEDARAFCRVFFDWYNHEHYHSGIALMTPATVHDGKAKECNRRRQAVLDAAFEKHPERFWKRPKTISLPKAVWINDPAKDKSKGTKGSIATTGSESQQEIQSVGIAEVGTADGGILAGVR